MTVVTGHQPVYLPWLGLFHKIALADVFVFMDDVQYLEQDWNNRNYLKGPHGRVRLTVPVERGAGRRRLKDVRIAGSAWADEHWRTLESCYRRAGYWSAHAPFFETVYRQRTWRWLVELNECIQRYLQDALGLSPRWITASAFGFRGAKSALILDHAERLGASVMVLGAHGRDYLDEAPFRQRGVALHYQDYRHPVYPQRFGAFVPRLSVVDLLFNCGPRSREIIMSGNVGVVRPAQEVGA